MNFSADSLLMRVMTWLAEMVKLQLFFWMGVLRGLIVGGIFPSLIAIFGTSRDMIRNEDINARKEKFWEVYQQEFKRANLVGYGSLVFAALLVIYFRLTTQITTGVATLFVFAGYGFIILFALLCLYIPTIMVHLDLSLFQTIKHAVIIMLACPVHTVIMGLMLLLFAYVVVRWFILVPFIAIAMLAFGLTYVGLDAINRLTVRLEKTSK
ncbi:YesL family protein [Fundicoccus culcitae]|uniref:DUF624 domain-containing protein n=1 Tax=Fundicoccus culcitae TaxID=2969821 RepID=A0ABY5P972_9LACT|nr:DUF624 domain-containing protein [Fundicoccus culcitae]UUX35301.1 DUF624 domain-containing protein [Fundicoccus culcitae]